MERKTEHWMSYLSLIYSLDVWSREVSIDFVDMLLVHVFRDRVLVEVVNQI